MHTWIEIRQSSCQRPPAGMSQDFILDLAAAADAHFGLSKLMHRPEIANPNARLWKA
jgi:hypothetical protein